jgi:hypothetical protein
MEGNAGCLASTTQDGGNQAQVLETSVGQAMSVHYQGNVINMNKGLKVEAK